MQSVPAKDVTQFARSSPVYRWSIGDLEWAKSFKWIVTSLSSSSQEEPRTWSIQAHLSVASGANPEDTVGIHSTLRF